MQERCSTDRGGTGEGTDADESARWTVGAQNLEATTGIEPVYAVLQTAP